jgi:hypothetical protein
MGMLQYKGINLFRPTKVSNLVAWYDASQITGLSDGDPIAQWNDLSGNGYHLLQATAANKPLYKTNGSLHLPHYVYFDGTDDHMTKVFGATYNQPNTIIIIGRFRNASPLSIQVAYDGMSAVTRHLVALVPAATPHMSHLYAGGSYRACNYIGPEVGHFGIMRALFNGASTQFRDSRSLVIADSDIGTQASSGFLLGAGYGTPYNSYAEVDICEIIFYNKILSQNEYTQLDLYLARKWGLKTFSLSAIDNFTRSDSAVSMGNCNSNQTWIAGSYQDANNPTLGISSNKGYFPATPGTDSHAYIETGKADCVITAKITFDSGADSDKGIIFRRVDGDNYFFLHVDSAVDNLVLSRCLAGVRSDIASSAGLTVGVGNEVWVRCYLYGNDIKCGMAVNSVIGVPNKYIETTDANLTTATKHGLYNHSGNLGTFSYFSIDDYPVP